MHLDPQTEKKLGYLSFVGESHKFIYVATPKAACCTIKNIIYELEKKEIPSQIPGVRNIHLRTGTGIKSLMSYSESLIETMLRDDTYTRFAVVRNPYSRVTSAWANKIHQKAPAYRDLQRKISTALGIDPETPPSFKAFIQWLTSTQSPQDCDLHWRPVSNILMHDLIEYHYIVHTEKLEIELKPVLTRIGVEESSEILLKRHTANESLPLNWEILYDEETAQFVYDFFSEDFIRYGYSVDSWKVASNIDHTPGIDYLNNKLEKTQKIALDLIRTKNNEIYHLKKYIAKLDAKGDS